MSENKKQHVIPKFYLKGFADNDNKIYQFSMKTGKRCIVDIKDACTRNYFYDIGPEENHKFEKNLSIIESRQDAFLQKFLNSVRNFKCDLSDHSIRLELISFMVFMHLRSFNTRDNTNKAMEILLNTSMDFILSNNNNILFSDSLSDVPKVHAKLTKEGEAMWHRALIEDDRRVSEYLSKHDFLHIFCIKKMRDVGWKSSFYTSDNPVWYECMIDTGPYGIGLLTPGVIFTMPLAQDVFLVAGDADYKGQLGFDGLSDVSYLDSRDEQFTCEYIKFLNTKVVLSCKDMVFSSDSNLSLAKMIFKRNLE